MKRIEQIIILITLVCFGLFFTEIPYIDIICTIVFLLASSFYMFGGWYLFQDKDGVNRIGLSIFSSWVISLNLCGSLFIINLWPGNIVILYTSMLAALLLIFILITLRTQDKVKGEYRRYYNLIMLRVLIFTGILFSFYMKFEKIINPAIVE